MADALHWLQKADHFLAVQRPERALLCLRRAQKKPTDPFLAADLRFKEAEALRTLGRFREAQKQYADAEARYHRLKVSSEGLRAALGQSACWRVLSLYERADRFWRSPLWKERYDQRDPGPADVHLEEALVARGLGDFDRARTHLQDALRTLQKDPEARQHVWWVLGGVERFSGRLAASEKAFARAVREARGLDPATEAYARCGWAGVLRVLGRGADSAAQYARAHQIFKKQKDPFGQAYGLCGRANAARTFGDYRPTLALYRQSAALYHRLGDTSSEGFAHWGRAGSLRRMGRWDAARGAYTRAHQLFQKSKDPRGLVMTELGRVWLEREAGCLRPAAQALNRAIALAARHRLPYEAALARWLSGDAAALRPFGVPDQAVQRWKDIP